MTIHSKVVSEYFSPTVFNEKGTLAYATSNQMNSGMIEGLCTVKDFEVYLGDISIFDNKMYDLSSLSEFGAGVYFERFSFDFWNTIPKQYVRVPGSREFSSGFFQLTFNQNPKIFKENISIFSLDILMAQLGGYLQIVYAMCLATTIFYRNYHLDMSLK